MIECVIFLMTIEPSSITAKDIQVELEYCGNKLKKFSIEESPSLTEKYHINLNILKEDTKDNVLKNNIYNFGMSNYIFFNEKLVSDVNYNGIVTDLKRENILKTRLFKYKLELKRKK